MKQTLMAIFIALATFFTLPTWANEESMDPHFAGIEIVVNINQADAEELATQLIGVGEKKALQIVAYRTENGPFTSADELANVSGIGPATVEKNRQRIVL